MQRQKRKQLKPRFRRQSPPGSTPGTLTATDDASKTKITRISYDKHGIHEQEIKTVSKLAKDESKVTWINVQGLREIDKLKQIAEKFRLHALAMEDVVNVHQRPKVEVYDDHLFIISRDVTHDKNGHIELHQVAMFVGAGFVLTFQERSSQAFASVKHRIVSGRGRIRQSGADYLAYALLDSTIDRYFPTVDTLANRLDELEEAIDSQFAHDHLREIHAIRNDLLSLRRSIRSQRDAINELIRDQSPLISDSTRIFLRDCFDHTIQLLDFIEVYREMCSSLRDFQMSIASNRLNEVMRVLTIISTIFIPLSFIAGLYGMNFNTQLPGNMPELNQPYGYVVALSCMFAVAGGMIIYFWRKRWIGRK